MECPHCYRQIKADAKSCPACGGYVPPRTAFAGRGWPNPGRGAQKPGAGRKFPKRLLRSSFGEARRSIQRLRAGHGSPLWRVCSSGCLDSDALEFIRQIGIKPQHGFAVGNHRDQCPPLFSLCVALRSQLWRYFGESHRRYSGSSHWTTPRACRCGHPEPVALCRWPRLLHRRHDRSGLLPMAATPGRSFRGNHRRGGGIWDSLKTSGDGSGSGGTLRCSLGRP
jgi:hypothetical protein